MSAPLQELIISLSNNLESIPNEEVKQLSQSHLKVLDQTLNSQHHVISNYELLVKKLELQLIQCQMAMDDGAKREAQMKNLVTNMMHDNFKLKTEMQLAGGTGYKPSVCQNCENLKEEIEALENQNESQNQVINKLSEAQQLLLMQYQALELSLEDNIKQEQLEKDEVARKQELEQKKQDEIGQQDKVPQQEESGIVLQEQE
ncbi:UNKNOWN [Stylonychia lemnae]|uniref:Uncharacterized protein n=1 Tax=Stylonychia lemnae TaxID=5949 RepID=A0A078B6C1_STYLE|nr:UNKNOWN [Stylonychia lemnae]|eukprot:CDW89771.1 UNKNOWN [Stylonychia lemnae]